MINTMILHIMFILFLLLPLLLFLLFMWQYICLFMFISIFPDIKKRLEGRKQGWTNAHSFLQVTGPTNMCQYVGISLRDEIGLARGYLPIFFCQKSVVKFRPSTAAESLGLYLLGRVWNRGLEHNKDSRHKWHTHILVKGFETWQHVLPFILVRVFLQYVLVPCFCAEEFGCKVIWQVII